MQALLDRLKEEGCTHFVDPDFPHNNKSLGRDEEGIVWLPAGEFYKNCKLFSDGVCANDIRQGELGDCYFLSSVSVLAEKRGRIEQMFRHHIPNDLGVYCVTMYLDGACRDVILDDYFPCDATERTPKFSYSNGEELWVLLLEKAYAKLRGSYYNLEAGTTHSALIDLTAEPVMTDMVKEVNDKEMWDTLTLHDRLDHAMCCSCGGQSGNDWKKKYGLIPEHGYGLLGVKEYKGEKLLRLRNPWGCVEWNGKWSDGDTESWTPEAKRALHYVDADDGSFWISFEDFKKYYACYTIDQHEDGWTYKSIPYTLTGEKNFFTLKTEEQTDAYVSVYLKSSGIGCRICVLTKEKPFLALGGSAGTSFLSSKVPCTERLRLPKGEFIVLVEVYDDDVSTLPSDCYVSVYSSSESATLSATVSEDVSAAEFYNPKLEGKYGSCTYCSVPLTFKRIEVGETKYHVYCLRCYSCGKNLREEENVDFEDGHLVCNNCKSGNKPEGKPAAVLMQEKVQAELKRIEEERIPKKPAVVEQHHAAEEEQAKHKIDESQISEMQKKSEESLEDAKQIRADINDYKIRRLFSTLDIAGTGSIDSAQVPDLCIMLGLPLSTVPAIKKVQAKFIMSAIDEDESGEIDYKEFSLWYKESNMDAYSVFLQKVEMLGVFFLTANDGEDRDLNADEMKDLHTFLSQHDMFKGSYEEFVKTLDADGSGSLSMYEFICYMLNELYGD